MPSSDPKDLDGDKGSSFDYEEILQKFRIPIAFGLLGIILIGLGIVFVNRKSSSSGVEIVEGVEETDDTKRLLVIEVSGAVEGPGVFEMEPGKRVEDALLIAGGITTNADTNWMEKVLNRAAKLTDGQKIYIPSIDGKTSQGKQSDVLSATENGVYQSDTLTFDTGESNMVNINTSGANELEALWGIGPVTAQSIIEHRMYSNVEELLQKGILKSNVYERNKDYLTVY